MRLRTRSIAMAITAGIMWGSVVASSPQAIAISVPGYPGQASIPQPLREATSGIQGVADELRMIFERYVLQNASGRWFVNEAAAKADNAPVLKLQEIARAFNLRPREIAPGSVVPMHAVGTGDWGKCVLNMVVPGAIDGLVSGGIVSWLAKGQYARVASYLLRVVGPAALKGGGIGLVATLAAGVAWCSTPWAA